MIDDKLLAEMMASEEGIERADHWLYIGLAITLINVVVAGYVWWVKP